MNDTKSNNDPLKPIENRVANSGLITINLLDYGPEQNVLEFDLKDFLFQGLVLREKTFREQIKAIDFTQYENSIVALHCSTDALIQNWAYMLVASRFPQSTRVYFGSENAVKQQIIRENICKLPINDFKGQRVIIKGCGDGEVDAAAYIAITRRLQPIVQSLMYGEACSNVPILKNKQ